MKIQRNKLLESISAFAKNGNGVIVGSPGIGKSYILSLLSSKLEKEETPCLFLSIDQLGEGKEKDLRNTLKYEGDFTCWLAEGIRSLGGEIGILIFDGFDAVRNDEARLRFLKIIKNSISDLNGLWNTIVSVRTYDAKKSQELLRLFDVPLKGDPKKYTDKDINCRHFVIPKLKDSEIRQVTKIKPIFDSSSESLKKLLRIPFNLWLIERILENPHKSLNFNEIYSESQILDVFWNYRVSGIKSKIAREIFLSKITRDMVENRVLSVRKEHIEGQEAEKLLEELLNDEILVELPLSKQKIGFYHNILFDYAVSILIFDDNPEKLVDLISKDKTFPIFLRPSLNYYFTRLWYNDRDLFWQFILRDHDRKKTSYKLFTRVLPTSIIVKEAKKTEDLEPLLRPNPKIDNYSKELIFWVIQTLRALDLKNESLWAKALERISENIDRKFVWDLASLTTIILDKIKHKRGNSKIKKSCGSISRNILKWALQEGKKGDDFFVNEIGAKKGIPLVIRTFNTNKNDSKRILENALSINKDKSFPIQFLFRLSDSIDKLVLLAPDLVSKIYLSILLHHESSDEQTSFGSPIITFLSTRKQDFEMCYYNLMKHFPKFLKECPLLAAETVINSLNQYIIDKNIVPYLKEGYTEKDIEMFPFMFRDVKANIINDMSYIWNQSSIREDPIKMADELFSFIDDVAEKGDFGLLDKIINLLRDKALVAFFWKELLIIGAKKPEIFADRLYELCLAKPLLISSNTLGETGAFLEEASTYLSEAQIKNIEDSIFDLSKIYKDTYGSIDPKDLKNIQEKLIARIPKKKLVTKEAKKMRASLEKQGLISKDASFEDIRIRRKSPESFAFWEKEGLAKKVFKNKKLKDLYSKIESFSSKWRDIVPPKTELHKSLETFGEIFEILTKETKEDENVLKDIWIELASSANLVSRIKNLKSEEYRFCRKVLLECAKHPLPEANPKYDENYNFPGWSPYPRNEAAQALPMLASLRKDKKIVSAIEKLIKDKVPSVRYLAARYLFLMFDKNTKSFWKLAKYIANNEENRVVQNALCYSLLHVGEKDNGQTVDVLSSLVNRIGLPDEDSNLVDSLTGLIISLCIVFNDSWAKKEVMKAVNEPLKNSIIINRLTFHTMSYVKIETLSSKDGLILMDKAIKLLDIILKGTAKELQTLQKIPYKDLGKEVQSKYKDLYMVFDETIFRIYNNIGIKNNSISYPEKNLQEFYNKVKPLLKIIEGDIIIHARTALHLMEFINVFLKFDPKFILHLATNTVKASKSTGFQIDTFAIREVVKLVEVILADFRKEVQDSEALEDLLDLLDIFCEAGWPEAIRLVWRLDEIFR